MDKERRYLSRRGNSPLVNETGFSEHQFEEPWKFAGKLIQKAGVT